jgi:hypothetical protein
MALGSAKRETQRISVACISWAMTALCQVWGEKAGLAAMVLFAMAQ